MPRIIWSCEDVGALGAPLGVAVETPVLGLRGTTGLRRFEPRECVANNLGPLRIFRRFGQQRAPYPGGVFPPTVLLGREALIKTGAHVAGIETDGCVERLLRFRRDSTVIECDECLAQIGLTLRCGFEQAQSVGASFCGIFISSKPHVDRRDHFPSAAVVWILREVRLDPREQGSNGIAIPARLGRPLCNRLSRQIWRAKREIKASGTQGQHDDAESASCVTNTGGVARPAQCSTCSFRFVRRKQSPGYLDPCRLGLTCADASGGQIAFNLIELVAIYGAIAITPRGRRQRAVPKWPQGGGYCCYCHYR